MVHVKITHATSILFSINKPKPMRTYIYKKMSMESEFAKQMLVRGLETATTASTAAALATNAGVASPTTTQSGGDLQNLKEVIRSWRQLNNEVSDLNAQLREKKKRQKALEDVILRTMKNNTIGALDLTGSGGRIIYRRQTTKDSLNLKLISELLAKHLKSEEAAKDALKYMLENRGGKLRESIMFEKE